MVKKISFKASKLIYIEIQNAEAVQCYQILFFIFMCKYKIILQNLRVFSWELSNSRKDETAAKCILIIQLHNNQWSCIPEKIQIFVVISLSPCKEMYNFKRVGMKIIYRITDTMIHRKKIRNIQLGFEFDRN